MAYTLRENSVEESFTKDKQQVTRTFFVDPWSSRIEVLQALAGGVRIAGDVIYRQLPARDPTYPWLFANDVKFKPIEDDPGVLSSAINPLLARAAYTTGLCTAVYNSLDNDGGQGSDEQQQSSEQQEMDLATHAWDLSARSLKVPNQWFVWTETYGGANDNAVANTGLAVTKVYPQINIVITRHLVIRKPGTAILSQLGRVNFAAITLSGDTFPAETLRLDSAKTTRKFTNLGAKFYEITYSFACQPTYDIVKADGTKGYVGWLRQFDFRKERWRYVRTNAGGGAKYLYDYDEDGPTQTFGGQVQKGFKLLFDPRAK